MGVIKTKNQMKIKITRITPRVVSAFPINIIYVTHFGYKFSGL
jgi:hypothetical protein